MDTSHENKEALNPLHVIIIELDKTTVAAAYKTSQHRLIDSSQESLNKSRSKIWSYQSPAHDDTEYSQAIAKHNYTNTHIIQLFFLKNYSTNLK